MPAGTDLIFFDNPEDWETIASVTKRAEIINENSHTPIPAFDLGVTLNTDYIAIVATTSTKKPTWNLAGDIAQVYDFASGAGNPLLSKIQPVRNRIWIDKLQLIETNRVSTDSFRLRFTPVSWFVDCAVRVYKYTGDTLNFVEDTLFDIGNALGVDPNGEPSLIANQLDVLEELITDKFIALNQRIDNIESGNSQQILDLLIQIKECACNGGNGGNGLSGEGGEGKFFGAN